MERKIVRTITEVLNIETGEHIDAHIFLDKPIDELTRVRSELQRAIEGFREPLFVCYYCQEKIRIRGGYSASQRRKAEIFHFAHLKDSPECHIKTKNQFTKEEVEIIRYNRTKESKLHIQLKEEIAECLSLNEKSIGEVSEIQVERVINNKIAKEWKKPDINAIFQEKRIAIELQLSTTWLSVITRRQEFYRKEKIFILWVFHVFNTNDLARKLTYNDVIYTNNQNAFLFDQETLELSKKENDLILKCFYKESYNKNSEVVDRWQSSLIKLSDLTFDTDQFRLFYHDSEKQKDNIENEIENQRIQFQEAEKKKKIKKLEGIRKAEVLKNNIERLNKEISTKVATKNTTRENELFFKRKLNEENEILSNVSKYTQNLINHFFNDQYNFNPLQDRLSIYNDLKIKFSDRVLCNANVLVTKETELKEVSRNLEWINNLEKKDISSKIYSCINNKIDWKFIETNFTQIKMLHKQFANDLFVSNEIREIKNKFELSRFQNTNDQLFLMDFSNKIKELKESSDLLNESILQQVLIIEELKEEIKNRIEHLISEEMKDHEMKINECKDQLIKLNEEVVSKENEIQKVENQIYKLTNPR